MAQHNQYKYVGNLGVDGKFKIDVQESRMLNSNEHPDIIISKLWKILSGDQQPI